MSVIVSVLFISIVANCDSSTKPPTSNQPSPYTPRPIVMKDIPAGTFSMGASTQLERPIHAVTLSDFAIQETEVTQGQYAALMEGNPAHFNDGGLLYGSNRMMECPVEEVTWYDAVLFCNKLSKLQGKDTVYRYKSSSITTIVLTEGHGIPPNDSQVPYDTVYRCDLLDSVQIDYSKKGYRLPTEAEWEYACRGGTTSTYWWGEAAYGATVDSTSWYLGNGGTHKSTHSVATKAKNPYGLYDMTGNVWEWCNDWFGLYDSVAQTNPIGSSTRQSNLPGISTGNYGRIIRGGSWYDGENGEFASAFRDQCGESLTFYYNGFRVAISK